MRESMDLVVWILAPMQGDPSQHPPTQTPPSRCRAQGFAYPYLYRDVVVLLLVFWLHILVPSYTAVRTSV